jgi:hypothetical protein
VGGLEENSWATHRRPCVTQKASEKPTDITVIEYTVVGDAVNTVICATVAAERTAAAKLRAARLPIRSRAEKW